MPSRSVRGIDKIYSQEEKTVSGFRFDRRVADVFDDMIVRSVPFYHELQGTIVKLAARFVQKGSHVYDLGCATGTTLRLMSKAITDRTVRFHGVDSSIEMIEKAGRKIAGLKDNRMSFHAQDLSSPFELINPSVVVMAFTLQFLKPLDRRALVEAVHNSLKPNGCLILTEKVLGTDTTITRLMEDFYCDFKRAKGYSELEIAQKRQALENILVPYRFDDNVRLLYECGFPVVEIFFKWFNFAGVIAVKARPQDP